MPPPQKTLVRDAAQALQQCPVAALRVLTRRATACFDDRLAAVDLSYAQFNLLLHVATAKNDTIGEVARQVGLDISTLSRNLRRLEAAGLVELTSHRKDMRRRAVWLTESGARRLERGLDIWKSVLGALDDTLGLKGALARLNALPAMGLSAF